MSLFGLSRKLPVIYVVSYSLSPTWTKYNLIAITIQATCSAPHLAGEPVLCDASASYETAAQKSISEKPAHH